jgi:hypothetical protein
MGTVPHDHRDEADLTVGPDGLQVDYIVLSADERTKGFVRPVRQVYTHLTCGMPTRMRADIAETYARDPSFYGATFCAHCRAHFPVGAAGEFVWVDDGRGSPSKVGT